MYAVIRSGGKQYRVEEGQRLEVERLGIDAGRNVELTPVLLVDGATVLATPAQLGTATVSARVVEPAAAGPRITGFTYKSKSNQRRRWGHRQRHSVIEITSISAGGARKTSGATKSTPAKKTPAKKTPAKKTPAKKTPAKAKKTPAKAKKTPAKKTPAQKGSG
jgi:large subunit ribosomal protein L21